MWLDASEDNLSHFGGCIRDFFSRHAYSNQAQEAGRLFLLEIARQGKQLESRVQLINVLLERLYLFSQFPVIQHERRISQVNHQLRSILQLNHPRHNLLKPLLFNHFCSSSFARLPSASSLKSLTPWGAPRVMRTSPRKTRSESFGSIIQSLFLRMAIMSTPILAAKSSRPICFPAIG